MALELYEASARRLTLSEAALARLDDAQRELHRRTGRWIDAVSTSTLEPAHARLWLQGLREILPNLRGDAEALRACTALIELLNDAISRGVTLILDGE
jgi:hypothetical protein